MGSSHEAGSVHLPSKKEPNTLISRLNLCLLERDRLFSSCYLKEGREREKGIDRVLNLGCREGGNRLATLWAYPEFDTGLCCTHSCRNNCDLEHNIC